MSALVRLGGSDVEVPALSLGTWSWGDERYWQFDHERDTPGVVEAFLASADAGLLVDTAEVYGEGASERMLGFMASRYEARPVLVATKFGLLPGRTARTLPRALAASLRRLKRDAVDLHQIHWADASRASIASLMDALADVHAAKLVRAVGVSNFTADELRRAHAELARRGVPLATCQVRYGLLDRAIETNGVFAACRELGVTLLAYSPLAQGVLAGSYDAATAPSGARATEPWFSERALAAARPLVARLRAIGERHRVAPSAVALRWVIERGAVPIAGARRGEHARANLAALSFALDPAELAVLDAATAP